MSYQEDKFLAGEGDQWFLRNKSLMDDGSMLKKDPPLSIIEKYNLKPLSILEIGCSNGYRLAELKKRFNCRCVGIEPSVKAIEEGKKLFPEIEFIQGTLDNLPTDEKFDLVIINYVLHWISRDILIKALSELDRVVKDGGHLVLGDFLPDFPCKNKYHHLPEDNVFTYKTDYSKILLSSGLYTLVATMTYEHSSRDSDANLNSQNRGVCSLMRKSLNEFYIDTSKSL